MFDLSTLKSHQLPEAVVEILHPATGEKTGIKITVASPDSELFRKVDRRIKNRTFAHVQKKGTKANITAEMVEENGMELLCGITLAWEGVTWSGSPMEFSADNISTLYTEFPFIRDQVDEFVGDRQNFFVK